jgi:MFS family permease
VETGRLTHPAEQASKAPPPIGVFASLRVRNFRLLLIGTTLSNAAQWVQQVTISWLVYDLTASGTALGTINLVRALAMLGTTPVAGTAIDRIPRRSLMLATAGWLCVASAVLGLLLLAGRRSLWYLYAFTLLGGVAQAFDMPLRQTVVFLLLPRDFAPNGVALVQTGWSIMRSVGPGIGGFLILWFGPGGNFLVQAAAYVLIALNTLRIAFPPEQRAGPRAPFVQNLAEGFRYVLRERTTRTFVMMGWVLPLLIIPVYTALPPIYAKDVFHGGPQVLGMLLSSVGLGGICGGLVTASLGRLERRGLVQLGALLLLSLSLIAFALCSTLWLALVFLALSGFFEMIYLTTNQTLLQLSIPDELRGRVTSIVTLNVGLGPLGALFAGGGADLFGPQTATIIMCTVAAAVAVGVFLFSPTVRDYRLSHAIPPGGERGKAPAGR